MNGYISLRLGRCETNAVEELVTSTLATMTVGKTRIGNLFLHFMSDQMFVLMCTVPICQSDIKSDMFQTGQEHL